MFTQSENFQKESSAFFNFLMKKVLLMLFGNHFKVIFETPIIFGFEFCFFNKKHFGTKKNENSQKKHLNESTLTFCNA